MDPLSLFVAGVTAAGGVALAKWMRGRSRRRESERYSAWQRFAARVDARMTDTGGTRSLEIFVERGEALVRISRMKRQRRQYQSAETLVDAYCHAQGLPTYHLYADPAPGQMKISLIKDHEIGYEPVDDAYILKTDDPDRARPVLAEVVGAIEGLVMVLADIKCDGERVCLHGVDIVTDPDDLEKLVALAAQLASAESHTGVAALRALDDATYHPAHGAFDARQPSHAVLDVAGVDVRLGPCHGGRAAPWPSSAARATWPRSPGHATVHIDHEGGLSGDCEALELEADNEHQQALLRAVGRARLRLVERELSLLWPEVIEDEQTLRAGAQLVGELCAVSSRGGAYR